MEQKLATVLLAAALSLLAAAAIHFGIEKPALVFRDKKLRSSTVS